MTSEIKSDVPELVRYDLACDFDGKKPPDIIEVELGEYVRYDQAAAVIERLQIDASNLTHDAETVRRERDALITKLAQYEAQEPVAVRHGWDGDGFQYIDNGSGSDWKSRKQDGEFLYAAPVASEADLKADNEVQK